MRLSTLTQRSELRAAEDRHGLAGPIAVIALLAAAVLACLGLWPFGLGVAAVGGFLFAGTRFEMHQVGDPASSETFYRLADPRQPLELPGASADDPGRTDIR